MPDEIKYAVAFRDAGSKRWKGLAAYPWCNDPSGAERIKEFLEETRALPFEYAIATITIEAPNE